MCDRREVPNPNIKPPEYMVVTEGFDPTGVNRVLAKMERPAPWPDPPPERCVAAKNLKWSGPIIRLLLGIIVCFFVGHRRRRPENKYCTRCGKKIGKKVMGCKT